MQLITHTAEKLKTFLVRPHDTLRRTMEIMSRAGLRFIPVIDADGRMAGAVADGDIRRYIAAGGRLDDPVLEAINRNPIQIDRPMPPAEIRAMILRFGIESLPELRNGRLQSLHVLSVGAIPSELSAVMMAGGLGSRLSPLTDDCPKPLLMMGDKPILTHIIEQLRDQGIRRFIISVNYMAEMLVNHYSDGSDLGVSIEYVHETQRMGTGGALGLIDARSLPEHFLVCNADLLNDIDVPALLQAHKGGGWDATMVVREHSYTIPYGVVNRSKTGAFVGAEEKPTMSYCINAGIYMLSKSVLDIVPKDVFYDLPTLFSDLPQHGMHGGTYTHSGRWIDIGTITDFNRARSIYEGRKE